ncbi:MAG TPA: transglycosylase domain-containing protein [Lactobacillaceae bacterium]
MSRRRPAPASKKKTNPRRKKKRSAWRIVGLIVGWLATLGVIAVLAGAAIFFQYAKDAPNLTESELASANSSRILDSKGNVIWNASTEERDYAQSDEIPKVLKNAVVSIEDRRFYKHNGVDPVRIAGALVANIKGSSLGLQGGSTLTQQLVKLSKFSTATSDQTIKRKAEEAWLAMRVEKNFTKDQILTFYVNKVYMGHGVYGMKTASEYYYDKPLTELSLAQTALIAGIPQSPTSYDPYTYPKYAKYRRDLVLDAMVINKIITQKQADAAKKVSIKSGLVDLQAKQAANQTQSIKVDSYVQSVKDEVKALGYNLEKDHLTIYTSMDSNIQQKLYDTVNDGSVYFASDKLQVGATMTDPNTGRVIAQIGGRKTSIIGAWNHATQSGRSSGSSVKPLVDYAPAIEYLNWPTYRTVVDKAYKYPGLNKSVTDWDSKYMGNITMRKALAQSRNIPAVHTLEDVGGSNAEQFLNKLGIKNLQYNAKTDKYDEVNPGGQDAIGMNLSTRQEAAAFAAFANGGIYYKPTYVTKIVTSDGVTHNYGVTGTRAMKSSTAFMMTDMLKDVIQSNATAPEAIIPGLHQAGKSGLSSYGDNEGMPDRAIKDAWFTGYTKKYSLSVWTGYDEPKKGYISWDDQGLPEEVYKEVMQYAMANQPNDDWTAPDTVTSVVKGGKTEYMVKDASWSNGGLPETTFSQGVAVSDPDGPSTSSSSKKKSGN